MFISSQRAIADRRLADDTFHRSGASGAAGRLTARAACRAGAAGTT
jgi:hypothetical protein